MQGDIVAVYNSNGVKVVSYTYDAWGNVTTTYHSGGASTGARYNPFRYRGYYYDAETKWYYLQTRYYNPAWGRFINADGYINANGDIIGFNMFVYCSNNPVMYKDPVGTLAIVSVIALVVTGVVALAMIIALNNEENNVVEEVIDVAKDGLEVVGEVNDKAEAVNTAINILDFAILLNTIYTSAEDFNKNQYVHITNIIGRARNPQYMVVYPNNKSKEEYDKHLICDMQWYFDQAVGIR
jgi:RHS repeat-associated protein